MFLVYCREISGCNRVSDFFEEFLLRHAGTSCCLCCGDKTIGKQ